jgi:hypothetical protein
MEGRLPNLLIIGAMKAGTTSLHNYLSLHPDIFMSTPKELQFFTKKSYEIHDLDWYKSFFKTKKKIAGASPQNYSKRHLDLYQGIPERMHKHIPNVKLIYILRDPIERYRSHLIESYYGGPWNKMPQFNDVDIYMKTSLYYYQLEAFLEYFDLDQIHITTLEELQNNKLKTLNKIFAFLEVPLLDDEKKFDFIKNSHTHKVLPYTFKKSLFFRGIKKISPSLAKKMNQSQWLKKYVFTKGDKIVLNNHQLDFLKSVFQPDIEKLRKVTGKSFDIWSI